MTQNLINFLSPTKLSGDNIFTIANYQFMIRLDSKNRIYRMKFYPLKNNRLATFIDKFISQIIDLDVEKVIKKIDLSNIESEVCFEMSEAHFLVREALSQQCYPGKYLNLNKERIICRCAKIDLSQFEQDYESVKGSLINLQKRTNAGLFCGGCSNEIEKYSKMMQNSKIFYEGKTTEEIYDIVTTSFSGFKEYTALDVSKVSIKLESVDLPKLKISLSNYEGDMDKLINSFENYLFSKLKFIMKIEYQLS